jgi:flagellar export protein FliJ
VAKDLTSLIRLHEWHVEERRRELGELLRRVAELEAWARGLEEELKREQRSAVADPVEAGFLYGNYALAVIRRREELAEATNQAEAAVAALREALREAHRELKKYEIAKTDRDRRVLEEFERKEQMILDELGIQGFRQRRA